jgi:hypothetical protein
MGGKGSGRPVTAPCGTVAAYQRHRRKNEQPCNACKSAQADYYRNRPRKPKKPAPVKPPKKVPYKDAHEYVKAQKRKTGVCAGYRLDGSKCDYQCVEGNEHHFDWDHILLRTIAGGDMLSKLIKKAKTYGVLDREIAKCQLLCKFCHANKSLGNNGRQLHKQGQAHMTHHDNEWKLFDAC